MNPNLSRPARISVVALAISTLALLAPATPARAQKAEPCIGGSWELSGPLAHTGAAIRMGFDVAIDEINEAGGVLGKKLRVIAYDDQGEPARAVDNARRIGEKDNCIIMIGGARTPNALAIRPVLARSACRGWASSPPARAWSSGRRGPTNGCSAPP